MDQAEKVTVEKLNDALQVVALLSATLRKQLTESAQDAVNLEAATWRATASIGQLRKSA